MKLPTLLIVGALVAVGATWFFKVNAEDSWTAHVSLPENNTATLEYVPLKAAQVKEQHNICVSIPHLRDSYWSAVAHGVSEEAKRLGQNVTLVEAGGYDHLERQLGQIRACIVAGADALVLSAISAQGNVEHVDKIRAKGIPVIDLVNGIDTQVDAKVLQSWYSMGHLTCGWVAERHPMGSDPTTLAWFPGPRGAAWSEAADQGCRNALEGSAVEIVANAWGDTGKDVQLELVEKVLAAKGTGLNIIVGTGPTIEVAVDAVHKHGLSIALISYYYNAEIHELLEQGKVVMAPADHMVLQGKIAIDQAVRLLEDHPMATGGSPEHVQPVPIIVTRENVDDFNVSTTLAP